jgi:hypothetical protein
MAAEATAEITGGSGEGEISDLEAAGLTHESDAGAESEADGSGPTEKQVAYITLVLDTRADGKGPGAEERGRARLRLVANTLTAAREVKAGDHLLGLAGDTRLSKRQAMILVTRAVEAGLLAADGTESSAAEEPASAGQATLLDD